MKAPQVSPTIVLLVVAIFLSAYVATVLGRVETRLKQVQPLTVEDVRNAVRTEISAMLTAKWTDATGVERTVTTTKKDSETEEEFQDRHDARVEAHLKRHPQ